MTSIVEQEYIVMDIIVGDVEEAKSTQTSDVELRIKEWIDSEKQSPGSSEEEVTSKIKEIDIEDEENQPIMTTKKKNRVLVSHNKKPFVFYLNLAKRCINQYNEVEVTAVGMAIPTVIKIAEVLKKNGIATERDIVISTVTSQEIGNRKFKPRLEIVMVKGQEHNKSSDSTEEKKGANEKVAC
ncbi:hypothetical protein ACFE04_007305 [Oxalis oulophora]